MKRRPTPVIHGGRKTQPRPPLVKDKPLCPDCYGDGWTTDPPHGYADERRCHCNPLDPADVPTDLGNLDEAA